MPQQKWPAAPWAASTGAKTLALSLLLMRQHLQHGILFWGPQYKKSINELKGVQWRATKTVRAGVPALSGKAERTRLGQSAEGTACGGPNSSLLVPMGGCPEDKARLFTVVKGQEAMGKTEMQGSGWMEEAL